MNVEINVRKNDRVVVIAGKDRGKTGRVIEVQPRKRKVHCRGRERRQASQQGQHAARRAGRHHRARIAHRRVERDGALPALRRADAASGHQVLSDGTAHARLQEVRRGYRETVIDGSKRIARRLARARSSRASARGLYEMATRLKERYKNEMRAGLDEGVQLHEPHGRAEARKDRFEHGRGPRGAEQPEGFRPGGDGAFDRQRARSRSLQRPRSRSRPSSCARGCPSAFR